MNMLSLLSLSFSHINNHARCLNLSLSLSLSLHPCVEVQAREQRCEAARSSAAAEKDNKTNKQVNKGERHVHNAYVRSFWRLIIVEEPSLDDIHLSIYYHALGNRPSWMKLVHLP
jgi:hypothetical protein